MQTSFKDLTWPLKVGVIGGWVALAVYVLSFMIGFILGVTGVM